MIEAIIFDCGKVLLDDCTDVREKDIADTFNISIERARELIIKHMPEFQIGTLTEKEFWTRFADELGQGLPDDYETLWSRAVINHGTIKNDVYGLAGTLKMKKYKIAILSNTEPSHAVHLRKLFPEKYFDAYVLSCEVGARKPDPDIYIITLGKLGVKSEKTIFIDDNEEMVTGARNQGLRGILFTTYEKLVEDLKGLGVRV